MLEGLIDSLGVTNFVLILVGGSMLVVVLLVMSYFKVLLSIANFTYPNAKYRAIGNPFIDRNLVTSLLDGKNINEVYQVLTDRGYNLSKEATVDQEELEKHLEERTIDILRNAHRNCPLSAKDFAGAWLLRYDATMAKRALKSKMAGEDLRDKLVPVRRIDSEVIENMNNARDIQEVMDILREAGFREPLREQDPRKDMFALETSLDRFVYDSIRRSVKNVHAEERPPVKYFMGKYLDIKNLKILSRGLREGVERDVLKKALLPPGRELEAWKLESMADAPGPEEAFVELEGTSYSGLRRDAASLDTFEIERKLDGMMLKTASEIMSQNVLTVGPILKFMLGKEMELRNLNIITRGMRENIPKEHIEALLVMEGVS